MDNIKRICIINQHTCNRGDEAAGRAAIQSLLDHFPRSVIDVLYCSPDTSSTIDHDSDRVRHIQGIQLQVSIRSIESWKNALRMIALWTGLKKLNFGGAFGELVDLIKSADIVINAPTGPNLGDKYKDTKYISNLLISLFLEKRLYFYGSSMGPFSHPLIKLAGKYILNRSQWICVRESTSLSHVRDLNLAHNRITRTADAAIQRTIPSHDSSKLLHHLGIPDDSTLVGLTPLSYQWYPESIRSQKHENIIINNLATVSNELLKSPNTNIIVFPQLFNNEGKTNPLINDFNIIKTIQDKIERKSNFYILPSDFDSDLQQIIISKCKAVIGMRYHSLIFAAKMRVPPIGITYEHKASAFMDSLSLQDLCMDIKEFLYNPTAILRLYKEVLVNHGYYVEKLNRRMPELENLSRAGIEAIVNREETLVK